MKRKSQVLIFFILAYAFSAFAVNSGHPKMAKAENSSVSTELSLERNQITKKQHKNIKERLLKKVKKRKKGEPFKFNVGAFFMGFLLGILGCILAAALYDKNAVKSAFIGFGALAILVLLIIAL